MKKNKTKLLTLSLVTAMLMGMGQNVLAHTRFEVNATTEGVRVDNSINISHICTNEPVIGQVTVFPEVSTALVDTSPDPAAVIGAETFTRSDQSATAFIQTLTIAGIMNRDTFSMSALIRDSTGNPIGVWSGGGSIPENNWVAKMPVRINPINIVADSCAKKVIIVPAIANVCQVTSLNEINGKDADRLDVDFWTAPTAGHPQYDAPAWNFPAPYTVNRDLEKNPLPASCGEGVAVRIYPSAAQLDRDFPVKINGQQVWPAP